MADYEPRRMVRCGQDHLVVLDTGMDPHELRGCPVCGAPCVYAGRCWVRQPDLARSGARGCGHAGRQGQLRSLTTGAAIAGSPWLLAAAVATPPEAMRLSVGLELAKPGVVSVH